MSEIQLNPEYATVMMPTPATGPAARRISAKDICPDRLPIILNSLTTAYDVVVVECGPTDAESIRRLASDGAEVLVSVISSGDENVAETAAELEANGYGNLILVTPAGHLPTHPPVPDRSAA